jgi:hypothetical protein
VYVVCCVYVQHVRVPILCSASYNISEFHFIKCMPLKGVQFKSFLPSGANWDNTSDRFPNQNEFARAAQLSHLSLRIKPLDLVSDQRPRPVHNYRPTTLHYTRMGACWPLCPFGDVRLVMSRPFSSEIGRAVTVTGMKPEEAV